MTKIVVLSSEDDNPQRVGITFAGELSPQEAQALCLAAARHFQELVIEEEVQRRVTNGIANAPSSTTTSDERIRLGEREDESD